ncbi:uncharacterized protein LOC113563142 [Ooceraea biroi]|uniref:uncharacterized protein LOC113563142 n=1 Tax=Ooceraea biroi TaxID=2015173 RepID=UPI000F090933|nr:uncharacterized protein LOC113563142 [Ooceraea biroi]
MLVSLEEFQERDSGWALSRILNLTVNVNRYNPLHAGCHVKVLEEIMLKRAVLNVLSTDNTCFAWSVVATLHLAESHAERCSSYPHYTTILNVQGIEFPITLNNITKFERLNVDISINVYAIQEKKKEEEGLTVVPIRFTSEKRDKHVNLLYIRNPQDDNAGHFAWIKNLSRLVSNQLSKKMHKKYICDRCLHYFYSKEKLEAHTMDCQQMNDCAIVLPNEDDKWLNFVNHNRKERMPFIVYADLECVLQKTEEDDPRLYQRHQVYSIGYYVRCFYDASLFEYRSHRDTNCVAWFAEQLKDMAHRVKAILSRTVPMVQLTRDERENFNSAIHYHICEKPFAPDDTRIRDHCHLTGRYRGPAYMNCNLNYKDSYTIPIVFHNLSGYDAHFIIKELANNFKGNVDVLPITKENYISFTKHVDDADDKK